MFQNRGGARTGGVNLVNRRELLAGCPNFKEYLRARAMVMSINGDSDGKIAMAVAMAMVLAIVMVEDEG